MTLYLNDEIELAAEHHGDMKVSYVCQKCGKRYTSKHPAVCHVPKCTAPKPPPVRGDTCTLCDKIFKTKLGLSQHERHEHPMARNVARTDGATRGEQAFRKLKLFTREKENRMLELEVRFREERKVADVRLSFMLGKTGKQIRDKRATS